MAITYGDRLIDSGYFDITPEQEREIEAREECERQGIDPDAECADGGVLAWMVVDQQRAMRTILGAPDASSNLEYVTKIANQVAAKTDIPEVTGHWDEADVGGSI